MIFKGRGCGCFTLLLAVFLIALTVVFHAQILEVLGASLVTNEPPEKADAAVALAGDDDGYRILTAGRLVRDGWAPYALVSGTPYLLSNHAEMAIAFAVAHGYPRAYFRPFERPMVATRDETKDIAQWLKAQGVHKILLVTSNYHTRRATFLMHRAAPSLQIRTVAAPDAYFTADGWWKTRGGQRTFLLEWAKTLSAWAGN